MAGRPSKYAKGKRSNLNIGAFMGVGGLEGGDYVPPTEGVDDVMNGPAGDQTIAAKPASFTKASVKHPILDAIFNKGAGSNAAANINAQQSLAQFAASSGLDLEKFRASTGIDLAKLTHTNRMEEVGSENKNKLDVQGLQNKGQLDTEQARGANTLANTTKQGEVDVDKQKREATNAWMKVHDIPPTEENFQVAQAKLFSGALANDQARQAGDSYVQAGKNKYLMSQQGQTDIGLGEAGKQLESLGINAARTRTTLGPSEISQSLLLPRDVSLSGVGYQPQGSFSKEENTVDPVTHLPTGKNITTTPRGIAGSFSQPIDTSHSFADFENERNAPAGPPLGEDLGLVSPQLGPTKLPESGSSATLPPTINTKPPTSNNPVSIYGGGSLKPILDWITKPRRGHFDISTGRWINELENKQ